MTQILVTGGAGFIGSHTLIDLINCKYDPIVYDNFSNSSKECIKMVEKLTNKKIRVIEGDIRDSSLLKKVFKDNNFHSVIHFAGLKAVSESVETPIKYYDNNISGSINLFENMIKFDVKKIVFSSSATVYGKPNSLPIKETTSQLKPNNPYGYSKYVIENLLNDIFLSDKSWSIINLRYFNPIGAHQSGLIGENPLGIPNNLMPLILQTASGKREKLLIYGNDYNTHDGTGVRDYIHVSDLSLGHLKALKKIEDQNGIWSINLGTGLGYSVLDIITTFENVTGRKIPYEIVGRRSGDIDSCFADPSNAKEILNWESSKGLEEMCKDSWRWQSRNPNGY